MSSLPNPFEDYFDSHEPRQELDSPFLNEEYLAEEARTAPTWRTPVPEFQLESFFLQAFEQQAEDFDELGEEESKEFEEALESFQQVHSLSGQEYKQLIAKFASGELEFQDFIPVPVEILGGGRIQNKKEPTPSDLIPFKGYGKTVHLHKLASEALQAMIAQARQDGISNPLLLPVSGYRSIAHQERLWQKALKKYHSSEEARKWVAKPGGSPHHSGRAVDLYLGSSNSSKNVALLRRQPAYDWLVRNAERFGFYPYNREPWHWEYNPPASRADLSGTGEEIFEDFTNGVEEELETEEFEEFFDNLNEEETDLYEEPFSTEEALYVEPELQNSYSYQDFFEGEEPTHYEDFLSEFEVPSLLKNPTRSDPLGQTLYVEIRLGKDRRCVKRNEKKECVEYKSFTIRPMTGIFIPENYSPQAEVDLILYLHGHKTSIPGSDALIAQYWDGQKYPFFALREEINTSKKNVILVAPTLGLKSESGDLIRSNGLDDYLNKVLEALKTYGPYKDRSPSLGKLILAAHSGGGVYMRMLAVSSSRYASKIKECWGFDSLYHSSDVKHWIRWAQDNPQASFYSYYFTKVPTYNSHSLIGKAPNIYPIESDIKNHFKLVKYYLRARLKGTQFLNSTQESAKKLSDEISSELTDAFDEFIDELDEKESEYQGILEGIQEFEGSSSYLDQEATEPELGELEDYFNLLSQEELYEQNEIPKISEIIFPSGKSLTVVKGETARGKEHYDPTTDPNDPEYSKRKVHLPLLPLLDTSGSNRSKKLSEDFTAGEFARSGGQQFEKARIDPKLVKCLQDLKDYLGKPIIITSGYRPYTYNIDIYKKRGEEPTKSQHTSGRAVDIKISGLSGLEIVKAALDVCGCNIGVGIGYTYAHIDIRGEFNKWTYIQKRSQKDHNKAIREITDYHNQKCQGKPKPGKQAPALPTVLGTQTSLPSVTLNLDRAVRQNEKLGKELGWDKYYDQIAYFLGYTDSTPGSQAFAEAVYQWQQSQRLAADGIIGKQTWKLLKDSMGIGSTSMSSSKDISSPPVLTSFPKPGTNLTPPSDLTAYRKFRLTTYHVASEPMVSSGLLVPVLTSSGNVIANVPAGFFAEMALEGRGRLKDSRLLTGNGWRSSNTHDYSSVLAIHYRRFPPKNKYHDKTKVSGITVVNNKVVSVRAYAVVSKPKAGQGYGVLRGIPLEPYRTVAADIGAFENSEKRYRGVPSSKQGRYVVVNGKTGLVPTGTQIYIRQLDGVILPNGKRHDGWLIVNDTGGGIFGAHFDVFVGEKQNGEPFIKMIGDKLVDVWFDGIEQRIPLGYRYGLT